MNDMANNHMNKIFLGTESRFMVQDPRVFAHQRMDAVELHLQRVQSIQVQQTMPVQQAKNVET